MLKRRCFQQGMMMVDHIQECILPYMCPIFGLCFVPKACSDIETVPVIHFEKKIFIVL